MSDRDLTDRQRAVLKFFEHHALENGVPPTVRQVMETFGFRSPNGAICHLGALVKKGFLEHTPHTAHAWQVKVPAGCCPTCGRPLDMEAANEGVRNAH